MDINIFYQTTVAYLNNQIRSLYNQKRYKEAIPHASDLCHLTKKYLGNSHPEFAKNLNNLAVLYQFAGDYNHAEPLFLKALKIKRNILGKKHLNLTTSLDNLAGFYEDIRDYDQVEQYLIESLEIKRKNLNDNDPEILNGIHKLAQYYKDQFLFEKAEQLFKQKIDIAYQCFGENHPDYATCLNEYALLLISMGDYIRAKQLLNKSLEINRKTVGVNHPNFATNVHNLAELCKLTGDYKQAEKLFKQSLEIDIETIGSEHVDFSKSINNLATLYYETGEFHLAKKLFSQALEIKKRILGEYSPEVATGLNNLAMVHKKITNHAQAEIFYNQSKEIIQQFFGEKHPNFANILNNLAILYMDMGNYSRAEPLLSQALKIYHDSLGEVHPYFAGILNNLAELYKSMGDYGRTELLYTQSMEINRQTLGEEHPRFATGLNNLAGLYAATDKETEALHLIEQVNAIDDRMIGQVFSFASESHRTAYLQTIQSNFDVFISLVYHFFSSSPEAIGAALDLILRRKGIGAETLAVQRDAVLGGRYPELVQQFQQLGKLRMRIAQKTLAGPGNEGLEKHRKILADWNKQKESLESELARQIPEMNLAKKLANVDHSIIAASLPEDTALIEFIRFNLVDFKAVKARGERQWQAARYLAFVAVTGRPDRVEMIDLGEAEAIEKEITRFRDTILDSAHDDIPERSLDIRQTTDNQNGLLSKLRGLFQKTSVRDLGQLIGQAVEVFENSHGLALRQTLFDPLLTALDGRTSLLISPDGELNRLPFEVLPGESSDFLLDEYHISYLGSGRDILRFGQSTSQPAKSLIIADPDFDLGQNSPDGNRETVGCQSRDLNRSDLRFGHLPATAREGENIGNMLGVSPWLQGHALESKLKQYRSPHILHFATHGFFLKDQKQDRNKELRDLGMVNFASLEPTGRLSGPAPENPLLRSGLALAGANTWLQEQNLPADAEDGLLTAEDVTGMDLLDTELVVLSACETGLGEIRTGEGVLGLRRSFVLAGADTLVMSLWKVPDEQTRELMENFYTNILAGEPRATALKNAQTAIRARHPHPLYWGAFICLGDPGPLHFKPTSKGAG